MLKLSRYAPNKVIWLLTMSDIFTWGAYYVISVLSGIYLANKLGQNTVEIVGIGTAIYFFCRAIFQLPVGVIIDRIKKDNDEIVLLAIGNVLMGMSFLLYPLISSALVYFILQFIFGVGTAVNLNTWRKLFAKNLDANKEGEEYGLYEVLMSLTIAVFSSVAGFIANISKEYFDGVMMLIGIIMMSGFIWPVLIIKIRDRKSID